MLVGAGIAIGVIAMEAAKPSAAGQGITTDELRAEASRIAALPKCAEVFRAGLKIDQARVKDGCLDPDGGHHLPGSGRCGDGRYLWTVAASSGAKEGWGFSGGPYTLTQDAASDPAYGRAYETCNS